MRKWKLKISLLKPSCQFSVQPPPRQGQSHSPQCLTAAFRMSLWVYKQANFHKYVKKGHAIYVILPLVSSTLPWREDYLSLPHLDILLIFPKLYKDTSCSNQSWTDGHWGSPHFLPLKTSCDEHLPYRMTWGGSRKLKELIPVPRHPGPFQVWFNEMCVNRSGCTV